MPTSLVQRLSEWMALPSVDVEYLISTAPRRYKVFLIPKRRGGFREIAQPSRELKKAQRLVTGRVLRELPLHPAAHGYVSGRGIRSNAQAHVDGNYILKMDFRDFFPSIRPSDLRTHLTSYLPHLLSASELSQVVNILFWRPRRAVVPRLCIGAPSSPAISNSIMYDVDNAICELAAQMGVIYTRYADDLTFSCSEKGILPIVEQRVHDIVRRAAYPTIVINHEKTVHISRAQRRMVTGVIISATKELSLGRDRKRNLRAMAHRYSLGQLDEEQEAKFLGMLAFANDVEPSFADLLRRRAHIA